ncbi:MAG: di-heme oxidoredictase family protein [Lentilitoribacter sp.]
MRNSLIVMGLVCLSATNSLADEALPWSEKTHAIGRIEQMPIGFLGRKELDDLVQAGEELFEAKFKKTEGAGRPMATAAILPTKARRLSKTAFARTSGPDAASCGACHNEPLLGGAGDFVTNVFVSEGFTNADFDSINPQFSNERGTNHLFGAGLIELLAREITSDLHDIRKDALKSARADQTAKRVELISKGISYGFITAQADGVLSLNEIDGIDTDLVVRPFSQKGVMTSLRQFTVNASNHHHGMQATERFGARWTGETDFDEDGMSTELSSADISALVAWQATLRPPVVAKPENAEWQAAAKSGANVFEQIGCVQCHMPALPLNSLQFDDPGLFDVAGTLQTYQVEAPATYDLAMLDWAQFLPRNADGQVLVPLFGDLKRHTMTDGDVDAFGNELMSQRFVDRNIFITAELWGVASTAPYGHRNDMYDLDEVISAHGGDARQSRDAYLDLDENIKQQLIAFLRTLEIK